MGAVLVALACFAVARGDPDTDGDGLTDFQEVHRYFTDPALPDSDGDGVPDGEWDERREFSYSVRAVMHVMAPFDVASMDDDYQDVRVLERTPDLLEFEVVVYPFNTVGAALAANTGWREQPPEMHEHLAPGVCCNWDDGLRAQLERELRERGIDVDAVDDVQAVRAASQWLMDRAQFEDSFTTFAVEFESGAPRVSTKQRAAVDEGLQESGRTLAQQLDRELFGKGMFEGRIHGSCTSSSIYLSTGLKALGIPTRTIVCVPIVDANDEREVSWIDARIAHVGIRAHLRAAAEHQRGSWTSHTFNEVFVGGRWRRLNYARLGQNVLDPDLGLMVHVHTFTDLSQAGLVGWGDRAAHPLHATLFGGPNPYSCTSLSDRFGAHATVPNEALGLREATIDRLYWYDDPGKEPELVTGLDPSGAHFFAHVDTSDSAATESDYLAFYREADKRFVLRASGRADIPARGLMKHWVHVGRGMNDFILRIEPGDLAHMESGVAYGLVRESGGGTRRWVIADGVTLTRAPR